MPAEDGKMRLIDVADPELLLRIIQSIPSPKAEPFKQWLAEVGKERLEELEDPELAISRAIYTYRKKGRSEAWINQRLKSIEVRKELTDEWERSGGESVVRVHLPHRHHFPCMVGHVDARIQGFEEAS